MDQAPFEINNDVYLATDLDSTVSATVLLSPNLFTFVLAMLWGLTFTHLNRYTRYIVELLHSFVPLIKTKRNLLTIKYQSTFFSCLS